MILQFEDSRTSAHDLQTDSTNAQWDGERGKHVRSLLHLLESDISYYSENSGNLQRTVNAANISGVNMIEKVKWCER